MDGQNKLANNDRYVFKTEPRADVVQKKAPQLQRLDLFFLKRNCLMFFLLKTFFRADLCRIVTVAQIKDVGSWYLFCNMFCIMSDVPSLGC